MVAELMNDTRADFAAQVKHFRREGPLFALQ